MTRTHTQAFKWEEWQSVRMEWENKEGEWRGRTVATGEDRKRMDETPEWSTTDG